MKSLIRDLFLRSVLKSVSISIVHLSKLKCLLLTVKKSEEPLSSALNESDYLVSDSQLGAYLNRSPKTVERYRYKGFIPFRKVKNAVYIKKTDVDDALKIYPFLSGSYFKPVNIQNPVISISVDKEQAGHRFVYLNYQFWNCTLFLDKSYFKDIPLLTDVLILAIYARHRIKPFKISPFDCNPVLNPVYKMLNA
jgi:hypothetical protein